MASRVGYGLGVWLNAVQTFLPPGVRAVLAHTVRLDATRDCGCATSRGWEGGVEINNILFATTV